MNVAILSQLCPTAVEQLKRQYDCRQVINPDPVVRKKMLSDAEVAVIRSPVTLDATTLASARRLGLVVRAGSGLDTIDLAAARERNIAVIALPLSADSVAEHVFGLLFSLLRRIPELHQQLSAGRWNKQDGWGSELTGKPLGLIGFGRIGQRVAEIAQAFRLPVRAFDRSPGEPEKQRVAQRCNVTFGSLESVVASSSIVSIQTPLNEQTRHLFDAERLSQMPAGSILINVGRGGIVDETALLACLRSGHLAGAALDVFENEPMIDSPLLSLSNFVGTPHVGAQTREAQQRVGQDVVRVIGAFAAGRDLSERNNPDPLISE